MSIKKLIATVTMGGLVALTAAAAGGGPPWSLFGDATSEKNATSAGPNPWVVELMSECPSFPLFTCFGDGSFTFGGIDFQPHGSPLTFSGISQLSTDYNVTDDDCGAGSPRFQLNMDTDGDGDFDGNVFVYIGPSPSFTGCDATTGWQTTGNLIGNEDACRYDTSQIVAGTQCNTYSGAATIFSGLSDHEILGVQLVIDSGWNAAATNGDGKQTILVDNVMVNNHVMSGRNVN